MRRITIANARISIAGEDGKFRPIETIQTICNWNDATGTTPDDPAFKTFADMVTKAGGRIRAFRPSS